MFLSNNVFTLNAFATHGKSVKLVNTPYLNGERLLVTGARLSTEEDVDLAALCCNVRGGK